MQPGNRHAYQGQTTNYDLQDLRNSPREREALESEKSYSSAEQGHREEAIPSSCTQSALSGLRRNVDDIDWSRTSWEEYRAYLKVHEDEAQRMVNTMTQEQCRLMWQERMNSSWSYFPEQAFVLLHVAINNRRLGVSHTSLLSELDRLALCFLKSPNPPTTLHIEAIHRLACDYIGMAPNFDQPMFVEQRIIFLIQAHCSHERMKSFLATLLTYKVPLTGYTLLHFMKRFVDKGDVLVGFEVLQIAVSRGIDTSSPALQSCCVQLLQAASASRSKVTPASNIYEQLVDLGVKPQQVLWTCIIQSAIEAGNHEEAWRWYDMGVLEGLKPNKITLYVLLKIAKQDHDQRALDRVIDIATEEGILPHDLDLVFDILHAVYVVHRSKLVSEPDRSFEVVLSYYSRYCDIEPLRDLGLLADLSEDQEIVDFTTGSQPITLIIGMMLLVYIRTHATASAILPLYHQYREYVAAKHPLIAPLANTDHIGNAFIKAFGSQHDYLEYCTVVIKDMLASTPFGETPGLTFKSTKPQQGGKPTVQTWNILLHCYMKQGHEGAADKVLTMMRSRGIEPDRVTWTSIIGGYARRQDVDNVVDAQRRMRDAGYEQDEITLKAVRRLRNKAGYFDRMEASSQSDEETIEERNVVGMA